MATNYRYLKKYYTLFYSCSLLFTKTPRRIVSIEILHIDRSAALQRRLYVSRIIKACRFLVSIYTTTYVPDTPLILENLKG